MGKYKALQNAATKEQGGYKYFHQYMDCYHCINAEEAEEKLKDKPIGTFLVRPSQNVIGGIYVEISYVAETPVSKQRMIKRKLICLSTPGYPLKQHPLSIFVGGFSGGGIGKYLDDNFDTSKALLNTEENNIPSMSIK